MFPNSLYSFCCQTLQPLQGLQLHYFSSRDSISLLHGKNHHCLGVKHLMPTLSTSLALMICVGASTHSRDSEIVLTITHAQDGQCHQLVRPTPSQYRQPTVAETWKDLRVARSLCPCKVHMSREMLVCVIVVLAYKIKISWYIKSTKFMAIAHYFPVCVHDFAMVVHCSKQKLFLQFERNSS